AAGQVDGDGLDAVDGGDLLGDRALAVRAGHAGHGERGRADERAGCAGQHGDSFSGGADEGRREAGSFSPAESPGSAGRQAVSAEPYVREPACPAAVRPLSNSSPAEVDRHRTAARGTVVTVQNRADEGWADASA